MRVINTSDKPKTSLKRIPPQSASRNMLFDLFALNFMSNRPIKKFITERKAPSKIDLKIKPDMLERRKNIVRMRSVRKEMTNATIRSCLSFFIISSFQSRFDESVHTGEYTEKGKYNC